MQGQTSINARRISESQPHLRKCISTGVHSFETIQNCTNVVSVDVVHQVGKMIMEQQRSYVMGSPSTETWWVTTPNFG